MSRILGEIRQLGYVVHDIEAAMLHWSKVMNVGPWFYADRVPVESFRFRGKSYQPHTSVALANSGAIQVELIQPRNEVPSVYREFLSHSPGGLQHIAYWSNTYDAHLDRMKADGFEVIMEGKVGDDGRFVYFDKEIFPGSMIELSEVAGPKGRMFDAIREASRDWDGRNPIRDFPNLDRI